MALRLRFFNFRICIGFAIIECCGAIWRPMIVNCCECRLDGEGRGNQSCLHVSTLRVRSCSLTIRPECLGHSWGWIDTLRGGPTRSQTMGEASMDDVARKTNDFPLERSPGTHRRIHRSTPASQALWIFFANRHFCTDLQAVSEVVC